MKKALKTSFQIAVATGVLFSILEASCFFLGMPKGATRFITKVIIQNHLSPEKRAGEYRIFTYGESTMYGAHYGVVSSPAHWLNAFLKDIFPNQKIRVVNFARLGCGSQFIANSFEQTISYQPDIAFFYIGHNGFLPGNRKDQIQSKEHSFRVVLAALSWRSRFISAVYRAVIKKQIELKTTWPDDGIERSVIEKVPEKVAPEDIISRNEQAYWENIEFTRQNIRKILKLAKEHGIHVVFLKPVCNLKDFAPSYSVHMKPLSPKAAAVWEHFYEKGKMEKASGNFKKALAYFNRAYAIDQTYADLSFHLGQIYFQKKDFQKARKFFEEARDHDAVISRATNDMLAMFEELQKNEGLQMINTEQILSLEVEGGILGEPIIEDNVHFSLKGHFLVGRALAEEMARQNWFAPRENWEFGRERSYDEIARELGLTQQVLISAYLRNINYFGSRLDNRIRLAQKILELEPDNAYALRHLAWAYWLNKDYTKAVEAYKKLGEVDPYMLREVLKIQPRVKKRIVRPIRLPAMVPSSV